MATLYLMVGLPCSGKKRLRTSLNVNNRRLRLTPDEWQIRLFGQDAEEPEHNARHSLIEAMLWNIASRALELGTNVILDFGFWAREEREHYRSPARRVGASSEVHYLDVSEDEPSRRLEKGICDPHRKVSLFPKKQWSHGLLSSKDQHPTNLSAENKRKW